MSDLYVTCRRCGGWGSIETSQSEDGRFSYQDQCPECSSHGVVPATPADILAAVRTLPGVEEARRAALAALPDKEEGTGMMSDLQAPPNYPVIVVHLDDGNGLTACTGQPMPGRSSDVYRNVPRYFCQACARVNVHEEEEMMGISADDLLYEAWTVIANAGWDGADKSEGWQEAAVRWRDKWHAYLEDSRPDKEEE